MEPTDMREDFKQYSDMWQGYFLNLTCDMGINKRQRHATLAFLKINRRHGQATWGPPVKGPKWAAILLGTQAAVSSSGLGEQLFRELVPSSVCMCPVPLAETSGLLDNWQLLRTPCTINTRTLAAHKMAALMTSDSLVLLAAAGTGKEISRLVLYRHVPFAPRSLFFLPDFTFPMCPPPLPTPTLYRLGHRMTIQRRQNAHF